MSINIDMYIYMYIYVYTYIYRKRERAIICKYIYIANGPQSLCYMQMNVAACKCMHAAKAAFFSLQVESISLPAGVVLTHLEWSACGAFMALLCESGSVPSGS